MITVVDTLKRTERWLAERGIPSPRLEAERLLAHALGVERLALYLDHARPLDDGELALLRPMVRRRGKREPLAWIVGTAGFHAVELAVGAGVLVPRPDTETLVEAALEWIGEDEDPVYVADVGCGSGALGLAIATARPGVRVYATDIADAPLQTTRANTASLGLEQRVAVLRGDLMDPIPQARPVDFVVSNPPYIPTADIDGLEPEVSQWEPREALDGGPDGLDVYRRLIGQAMRRARRGVLLEVGFDQAGLVSQLLRDAGSTDISTWSDLGGVTRVVGTRIP